MPNAAEVRQFFKLYGRSMRPYYFFITGFAGWAGIAASGQPVSFRMVVALVLLFLSWGINQIVNDYLGLAEDRINAPDRPMASGALNIRAALALSAGLMVFAAILSWQFSPLAVAFLVVAVGLNVAYEYSKAVPVLGNAVFGVMIALCYYFGLVFMLPDLTWAQLAAPEHLSLFVALALANSTMTYFTYFKDRDGDRIAGKRTLVVVLGPERAGKLGWVMALLPFAAMVPLAPRLEGHGWALLAAAFGIGIHTAWLYFREPAGEHAYLNLTWAFRSCAIFQAMVVGLSQPLLGLLLSVLAFVAIGRLFDHHARHPSAEYPAVQLAGPGTTQEPK